jgi:cytochrome b6-f complex iron-sulfur subunit
MSAGMERRGFLKILTSILGLSALGTLAYPLFRYIFFVKTASTGATVTVPVAGLPEGTAKDLVVGDTPAIIIHKPTGYIVLSRVCTHLGCLVNYHKDRQLLICPCHNGIYDLDGNVVSGPPPRPLPQFPFKVVGDKIEIG